MSRRSGKDSKVFKGYFLYKYYKNGKNKGTGNI